MEQEKRLCTLIISCQLYRERWPELIKQMEALNNKDFFIVCGDPLLPTEYHIIGNRFIFLKCNDYYEGLPEKIVSLYRCMAKDPIFSVYTYFCKVDDSNKFDAAFNFKELEKSLQFDYEGHFIFGPNDFSRIYHFGKCHDSRLNSIPYKGDIVKYCGGQMYCLSRKSIECFKNISLDLTGEFYEDLFVGKTLLNNYIMPQYNNYFKVDIKKGDLVFVNPRYNISS